MPPESIMVPSRSRNRHGRRSHAWGGWSFTTRDLAKTVSGKTACDFFGLKAPALLNFGKLAAGAANFALRGGIRTRGELCTLLN